MQEEAHRKIRDERSWIDALFSRPGSMVYFRRNLSQLGKACCGILKIFDIYWIVNP